MSTSKKLSACLLALALPVLFSAFLSAADEPVTTAPSRKVYGEWRILIKTDKKNAYNTLIESKGLPLFREAGGRMVGWWATAVGNLYEHVTIWEYDDMAAFEKAGNFLGGEKRFAEFVELREPLLAGEESRFLRLAEGAASPALPETSKYVIHEIHRVPGKDLADYLRFMSSEGLKLLKKHGFRPVGPWTVEIGDWSEVTYLFSFDSLAERERLIASFAADREGKIFAETVRRYVERVTTRLLTPAPFAVAATQKNASTEIPSERLPHLEQLVPGVYAAGFSDKYNSANCGWADLGEKALLVDLPRGVNAEDYVAEVKSISGKTASKLALTHLLPGDEQIVEALLSRGVDEILTSTAIADRLKAALGKDKHLPIHAISLAGLPGIDPSKLLLIPLDDVFLSGGLAVHLPKSGVLFAGPLIYHGPRTLLDKTNTDSWITALRRLERLKPTSVVPGFGSWGGPEIITRQSRFLSELRQQVAYAVSMGRDESVLKNQVRIPARDLVWMPYDTPTPDDLSYVYRELTVPAAPYYGHAPNRDDPKPHALVLVGDLPHEPAHIVEGLDSVFAEADVFRHFTVDVRALNAENLSKVKLLVILRDGLQRPTDDPSTHYVWMTPEQQQAVEQYVNDGGAFLNLHNSMGLYPDEGPYLKLVGGRYIGHGPLERFRVEVVDPNHPITRGIESFFVADEQHTPPYNAEKVHLLLRNRSDDGKVSAAAGWAYEPGKGRLCHLANGHTRESLSHPMYRKLMINAIRWCLRQEAK